MYKKLFIIIALPFLMMACSKSSPNNNCTFVAPTAAASASEIATLKTYLDANSLTYTQHPSGIFYNITAQGSGTTPTVCSSLTFKYSGRTTVTTTPFDAGTITYNLGNLIIGWQYGIPLIKKGGSITLYIPPSLGYGAQAQGTAGTDKYIPANSYLIFTIDLIDVK